jgi:hypothetical protein
MRKAGHECSRRHQRGTASSSSAASAWICRPIPPAAAPARRFDDGGDGRLERQYLRRPGKFGCKAALVTSVSDDAVGWYRDSTSSDHYGVDRSHVRAIGGECRTSLAVYETRIESTRASSTATMPPTSRWTVADVEAVDYAAYGALITTGTVFAAEPSRSASFRAFELARAAGLPIIFDIDYRPYSWPSPQVAEEVLSRAGALPRCHCRQ